LVQDKDWKNCLKIDDPRRGTNRKREKSEGGKNHKRHKSQEKGRSQPANTRKPDLKGSKNRQIHKRDL